MLMNMIIVQMPFSDVIWMSDRIKKNDYLFTRIVRISRKHVRNLLQIGMQRKAVEEETKLKITCIQPCGDFPFDDVVHSRLTSKPFLK